jgi:hypothetical protein
MLQASGVRARIAPGRLLALSGGVRLEGNAVATGRSAFRLRTPDGNPAGELGD